MHARGGSAPRAARGGVSGLLHHLRFLHGNEDLSSALHGTYDPTLVVVSVAIAALASYAALVMAERVAAVQGRSAKRAWLAGGAVTMGIGVWAMHFIGMLAFQL